MRQVIVISSILKPVTDVRSYYRLARSIANNQAYEVHISGSHGLIENTPDRITFHPLSSYSRGLFKRLLNQIKTFRLFRSIKPDLIIITAVELIPVAIIYKLLFSTKLVYDIQENYERNIIYQSVYPFYTRKALANLTRWLQTLTRRFFALYLLAEKCYENELEFIGKKYIILENKVPETNTDLERQNTKQNESITFLFSGTLAPETGVDQAVQLFQKIKVHFQFCQLKIVGFAANESYRGTLFELARAESDIVLLTGDQPLAYAEVLQEIRKAHIGIIAYPITPANEKKVPTKLYEYAHFQIPFIVADGSHWHQTGQFLGQPIPVQFERISPFDLAAKIKKVMESAKQSDTSNSGWQLEKEQLLSSIDQIL